MQNTEIKIILLCLYIFYALSNKETLKKTRNFVVNAI